MWFSNMISEYDWMLNSNSPYIPTENIKYIIQDQKFNIKKYKAHKNNKMELKKAIPLINVSFYYHILKDKNVPTFDEFMQDYRIINKSFMLLLDEDELNGLLYITARAYPSLIRDAYFVNKSREIGYNTIQTLIYDLNGVDAAIPVNDDITLKFKLFYNSSRSREYLKEKDQSHKTKNSVYFGLNKNNRCKIGNIYLYTDESIKRIIKESIEGVLELNN